MTKEDSNKILNTLEKSFALFNDAVSTNRDITKGEFMRMAADLVELEPVLKQVASQVDDVLVSEEDLLRLSRNWSPKFRSAMLIAALQQLIEIQQEKLLQSV